MVKKKPQVCILGESFTASGKGLYITKMFEEAQKVKDFDSYLFVRDNNPYKAKNVVKVKCWNFTKRLLSGMGYYIPLYKVLKKRKRVDLLHSFDERIGNVVSYLKKPHIVTVCDLYPLRYSFPHNKIFKKLYSRLDRADKVIAISQYTADRLIEIAPHLKDKVEVILLGVDEKKFSPRKKRKKSAKVSIRILGNLDDQLREVFKVLAKEYKEEIEIVLGGRLKPEVAQEFEGIKNIRFSGFISDDDLPGYYRDSDIFVYKTYFEGFGLIPLEAMACGCPTVTSDAESIPEVVLDGAMVLKNSEKAFYEGIKKLIEDKRLRNALSKKGRKRAEYLTWKRSAKQHIDLYRRVMRENSEK